MQSKRRSNRLNINCNGVEYPAVTRFIHPKDGSERAVTPAQFFSPKRMTYIEVVWYREL